MREELRYIFTAKGSTMTLARRTFLQLAAAAATPPAFSSTAKAQAYPSRPITMVVPYAPGGASDVVARAVAEPMRAVLGQPIVIENVTGAGGSIGVGRAARAAPDGYTLSLGQTGSHVMNGAVYLLPYDLVSDFEPVGLIATDPMLIVAKSAMPGDDLNGLIAWLKANPDKANLGNAGVGSLSHIAGILFQKESGTRLGSVPYPWRCRPCRTWWWQIDMLIADVTTSLAQVGARRVKAYAVTADARLSFAPDIPTVDEAGLPSFRISLWHGLWVPKRTPKIIIAKLNAALVEVLADPGLRARFADLGQEIFPRERQTPARWPPYKSPRSRNGRQSSGRRLRCSEAHHHVQFPF